jgi:hypothetical protein
LGLLPVATRPTAPSGYVPSKHSDINNTLCCSHLDALQIIAKRLATLRRDQAKLFGQVVLGSDAVAGAIGDRATQGPAASGVTPLWACRLRKRETGEPLAVLPQPHAGSTTAGDHL